MAKKIFNYVKDAREAQKQAAPVVFFAMVVGIVMWACLGCVSYKPEVWRDGLGPEWFEALTYNEIMSLVDKADDGSGDYTFILTGVTYNTKEAIAKSKYGIIWCEIDDYRFKYRYKSDAGNYYDFIIDRRWLEDYKPLE